MFKQALLRGAQTYTRSDGCGVFIVVPPDFQSLNTQLLCCVS